MTVISSIQTPGTSAQPHNTTGAATVPLLIIIVGVERLPTTGRGYLCLSNLMAARTGSFVVITRVSPKYC